MLQIFLLKLIPARFVLFAGFIVLLAMALGLDPIGVAYSMVQDIVLKSTFGGLL